MLKFYPEAFILVPFFEKKNPIHSNNENSSNFRFNADLKTGYINKNINSYKVKFFPARSTGFGSKPTRGIKDEKGVCAIRCTYASSRWELSGNTVQCWFPNLKKNVESLQNVDDYDIRLTLL